MLSNPVCSLVDFINTYTSELKRDYNDDGIRLYYRGENMNYGNTKCLPSIFRGATNEKENYFRYLRRHPEEFRSLSNLDILAKMQHYGIITRMLDITTNPLIALFFACFGKNSDKDGHVYVFKAKKQDILTFDSDRALLLSTISKLSDDEKNNIKLFLDHYRSEIRPETLTNPKYDKVQIDALSKYIYECERERDAFQRHHVVPDHLNSIFYVKPQFSSLRMKLQSSLFMLFGISRYSSLTEVEYFSNKVSQKDVIDIQVSGASKQRILSELKFICGISLASIFGDLESETLEDKEGLFNIFNTEVLANRRSLP